MGRLQRSVRGNGIDRRHRSVRLCEETVVPVETRIENRDDLSLAEKTSLVKRTITGCRTRLQCANGLVTSGERQGEQQSRNNQ